MAKTHDFGDDPRKVLYILLAGSEDAGPTARAAELARDKELAGRLRRMEEEVVGTAKARLARSEVGRDRETVRQEAHTGTHIEIAERAARRLESVADRLEEESRRPVRGGEILALSQELRVVAFMVRDEAQVVARKAAAGSRGAGRDPVPPVHVEPRTESGW